MRSPVILRFVGSFLEVFAFTLTVPLLIAVYYSESLLVSSGFIVASISSLTIGFLIKLSGDKGDPTTGEAMFATVLGWVLAIGFGSIPLLIETSLMNALFESAAGLTTTGISVFTEPSMLPRSILFWRSFMQWIGGLGILTFFIAVIRESGGTSRRLFSAEAHKTDSGSIRPSLTKSIFALWRVYGFLTVIIAGTYVALGMSVFNSALHAFSAISTGGFSTLSSSIAGFGSTNIEIATVFFMFLGGVNFVLLYKVLRGDFKSIRRNSEFRLYSKIFLLVTAFIFVELLMGGALMPEALLNSAFQSAAVISSTGYGTMSLMSLSISIQAILVGLMFVGGSLGSTSGGVKVFRLKTMIELLKRRLRAYSLPETAINEVKIDGEILEDSTVRTISVLFFTWTASVFVLTLVTLFLEDISLIGALSGTVSSVGNMGPVFLHEMGIADLSSPVKLSWIIAMIAGRLEMLPLLAIFNRRLFEHS